jgi:hypothetical protein
LQFSLQAAIPETFGYTLVFFILYSHVQAFEPVPDTHKGCLSKSSHRDMIKEFRVTGLYQSDTMVSCPLAKCRDRVSRQPVCLKPYSASAVFCCCCSIINVKNGTLICSHYDHRRKSNKTGKQQLFLDELGPIDCHGNIFTKDIIVSNTHEYINRYVFLMPPPIYQDVINLAVCLPRNRSPILFMNFSMWKHCALDD